MTTQTTSTVTEAGTRRQLAGSRLVLAGALLYLAEWVAIIGAGGMSVWFAPGTDPDRVLDGYAGHGGDFSWAAGWLGVVLTGRILFALALQHGLRRSGHDDPLAGWGVMLMVVGVVIETINCAVVAGIASAADHGASAETVATLDTVAVALQNGLWGVLGLSVLALTAAMLRSGLFPKALCGLGILAGLPLLVVGLALGNPANADVAEGLQAGAALMWIWMLWAGVLMWRRA